MATSRQRRGVSDPQAFRAIYEAHHAAVCAYFARRAPRDEVEDLAAETFAVAWRKLPRRVEHPLPWLYAVAGNVLANHRRKAARRGALRARPGDRRSRRALRRRPRPRRRVRQLSEREREAICLVAWEGLSHRRRRPRRRLQRRPPSPCGSRAPARSSPRDARTRPRPGGDPIMDAVLDRVRAANPASRDEFAGLADFDALDLTPRRRRRRWLAIPALGAVVAALVLIPSSAPQAKRDHPKRRAGARASTTAGSSTPARTRRSGRPARADVDGRRAGVGARRPAMRWLEDDGDEEVYAEGEGTTQRRADGKLARRQEHADGPQRDLPRPRAADAEERRSTARSDRGRDAYVLRWSEDRRTGRRSRYAVGRQGDLRAAALHRPLVRARTSRASRSTRPTPRTSRSSRRSRTPRRTVSCWSSGSAGPRGSTRGLRRSR